jgi:hypothetical protein
MPKVVAYIGLVSASETAPGVYTNVASEIEIRGDFIQSRQRWNEPTEINQDVKLEHRISFVASQSVTQQIQNIRYVKIADVKWSVTTITTQPPRLVLALGGVYNG